MQEAPVRDAQQLLRAFREPLLHAVDAREDGVEALRAGLGEVAPAVGIHVIVPVSPYSGAAL